MCKHFPNKSLLLPPWTSSRSWNTLRMSRERESNKFFCAGSRVRRSGIPDGLLRLDRAKCEQLFSVRGRPTPSRFGRPGHQPGRSCCSTASPVNIRFCKKKEWKFKFRCRVFRCDEWRQTEKYKHKERIQTIKMQLLLTIKHYIKGILNHNAYIWQLREATSLWTWQITSKTENHLWKKKTTSTNFVKENLVRSVSLFSPVFAFMFLGSKNLAFKWPHQSSPRISAL